VSEVPDLLGPAWQELIIGELLRYPASALREDATHRGLRPDAAACGPDSMTRLHVYRRGFDEPLTGAAHGQPALAEGAAQLCRDARVPLALPTNGRFWVLVHARLGEATSTAVFDADLWLEEPALLRAFASLCCASRVRPPPDRKCPTGHDQPAWPGHTERSHSRCPLTPSRMCSWPCRCATRGR
jgi:hypothetical protein